MILFTRAVTRDFLVLFAKCVSGRPRGPAPPVVIRIAGGFRTVTATTLDGVTLTHTIPAAGESDDLLVLPAAVLAEVEGGTDEPVTLERQSKLRAVVRWSGGGKPGTLPVELILPGRQHDAPELPVLATVSGKLLSALFECGRSAARESGRFAMSKIQVQGKSGRVIGTDGKVALIWSGFTFPFAEDVLLPALPVFGAKPLLRKEEARLGRTATHLVVAVGPWTVTLPTDMKSRFPDVAGVIPRHAPTTVGIDAQDAVDVLKLLPGLPGASDEYRAVTIEADGVVRLRGRNEATAETKEVTLIRSHAAGAAARVAIDRRLLARAIALGCHSLKLTPDKPLAAEGDGVILIAATLEPSLVVPPTTDEPSTTNPNPIQPERSPPMKPPETNGHTTPVGDPPDPLIAAEELRDALAVCGHQGCPTRGCAQGRTQGEESLGERFRRTQATQPRTVRRSLTGNHTE